MAHEPHRWKGPNAVPESLIVKWKSGFHQDHPIIQEGFGLHSASYDRQLNEESHRLTIALEHSEVFARRLLEGGLAEYAYPDLLAHQCLIPNDPGWGSQSALTLINMPLAWNNSTGSSSIIIADLGSGIATAAIDVMDNAVTGRNILSNNTNTNDTVGHGTAVAATMCQAWNNNLNYAGIAGNCPVMPILITNSGSATESNMTIGLAWVRQHTTAQIANISYASPGSAGASFITEVQACWDANIIITASAGDTNDQTSKFPANTLGNTPPAQIIAVSSCGPTSFNNDLGDTFGTWCTIIAPGTYFVTRSDNTITPSVSGTSFSAPAVAGILGLMRSINSALTPTQLLNFITDPANCFPAGTGYGSPPHPAIVIDGYKVTDAARGPRVANVSVGGF